MAAPRSPEKPSSAHDEPAQSAPPKGERRLVADELAVERIVLAGRVG